VIGPAFGPDSFTRHVENARAARVSVHTVLRQGFSRDLDSTEDLEYLGNHSAECLCITT
jgi:2-phospho-L-lactate guanylyltransferase (CobY/MobA/RfbA family)